MRNVSEIIIAIVVIIVTPVSLFPFLPRKKVLNVRQIPPPHPLWAWGNAARSSTPPCTHLPPWGVWPWRAHLGWVWSGALQGLSCSSQWWQVLDEEWAAGASLDHPRRTCLILSSLSSPGNSNWALSWNTAVRCWRTCYQRNMLPTPGLSTNLWTQLHWDFMTIMI